MKNRIAVTLLTGALATSMVTPCFANEIDDLKQEVADAQTEVSTTSDDVAYAETIVEDAQTAVDEASKNDTDIDSAQSAVDNASADVDRQVQTTTDTAMAPKADEETTLNGNISAEQTVIEQNRTELEGLNTQYTQAIEDYDKSVADKIAAMNAESDAYDTFCEKEGECREAVSAAAEAQKVVDKLNANIASMETVSSDIETKTTAVETANTALTDAENAKTAAENAKTAADNAVSNLEDEIKVLGESKQTKESSKTDLEKQFSQKESQISSANTEIAGYKKEISELDSTISNAVKEVENKNFGSSSSYGISVSVSASTDMKTIAVVRYRVNYLGNSSHEVVRDSKGQYHKNALNGQVITNPSLIGYLNEAFVYADTINDAKDSKKSKQGQIAEIEKDIEGYNSTKNNLQGQIDNLVREIEDLGSEIEEKTTVNLANARQAQSDAADAIAEAEARVTAAQTAFDAAQKALEEAKENFDNDAYQKALADLVAAQATLESARSTEVLARTAFLDAQAKWNILDNLVDDLDLAMELAGAKKSDLKDQIDIVEDEIEESEGKVSAWQTELAGLEEKYQKLVEEALKSVDYTALNAATDKLNQVRANAEALAWAQNALTQAQNALDSAKASNSDAVAWYNDAVARLNKALAKLQYAVNEQQAQQAREEIAQISTEIAQVSVQTPSHTALAQKFIDLQKKVPQYLTDASVNTEINTAIANYYVVMMRTEDTDAINEYVRLCTMVGCINNANDIYNINMQIYGSEALAKAAGAIDTYNAMIKCCVEDPTNTQFYTQWFYNRVCY